MQDEDGLTIARKPGRGLKRPRKEEEEKASSSSKDDVPDFSTLPKELWGMIAARCDVSRATLTTLMLLNKGRISAIAWTNFRFSPSWNYALFSRLLMIKEPARGVENHWELFGFAHAPPYLAPVEKYASEHIASRVQIGFNRDYFAIDVWHEAMCVITTPSHILTRITALLSVYRPQVDCNTLCSMFENMNCTVVGVRPKPAEPAELKNAPNVFDALEEEPLTDIHVALGYYNAYRAYVWKDYGVRLPKIELRDD